MERRLAAILAADVVGYSLLMGKDEEATLAVLNAHRQIIDGLVIDHRGRVFGSAGDSVIAEFASPVEAVRCGVEIQQELEKRNLELPEDRRMQFRIGVNLGDVMVKDDDLLGDGVNVAARLEGLAHPGGICISSTVFDQIKGKVKLDFADLGPQAVKNIAEPIRVYRLLSDALADPTAPSSSAELPLTDKPSIAILPFANISGDIDQEYLSDGFTEDIITALARYRSLRVIARNSSFSYKGQTSDARLISQDLTVRYVVEGSVRRAGEKIRVSVQLIDAEAGHHIWAERYDRGLEDIFAVQDEIAQTIAAAIIPEIGQAEQERAHRKPPQNLNAWEYYQRGLWHMYRFALDDLLKAKRLFERAIQRDPDFAAAYSGLAYALLQEVMYSEPEHPNELLNQGLDVARRGAALDDHDAFAHFVLGRVHVMHRELEIACVEFERAIDLNPSFAYPYFGLGIALLDLSRFEQALEKFATALRLSPRDPHAWAFIHYQAWPLLGLKRYEEAVDVERRALRSPNAGFWPYIPLIAALGHLERKEEAKKELERLQELQPAYSCTKAKHHLVDAVNPLIDHVIDGLRKAGMPE